jgi:hypothetical protein
MAAQRLVVVAMAANTCIAPRQGVQEQVLAEMLVLVQTERALQHQVHFVSLLF